MSADNSHHLAAAAQRRSEQTLARAQQALRELEDTGQRVTVTAVAARAGVSRAWLYTQPQLRQQIDALRGANPTSRPAPREPASDPSLRQRLALAHERIHELTSDNQQLRDQIAKLHGQLRAARLGNSPAADTVHDTKSQLKSPNDQTG
jgi:hypothetical protein